MDHTCGDTCVSPGCLFYCVPHGYLNGGRGVVDLVGMNAAQIAELMEVTMEVLKQELAFKLGVTMDDKRLKDIASQVVQAQLCVLDC